MFLWGPNYSSDTIISTLDYWLQCIREICKLLLECSVFLVKFNSVSFVGLCCLFTFCHAYGHDSCLHGSFY